LNFWVKFELLTKIWMFDQNFEFLTKIWIFDQNLNFWPKFKFLTNISNFWSFGQNLYFRSNFGQNGNFDFFFHQRNPKFKTLSLCCLTSSELARCLWYFVKCLNLLPAFSRKSWRLAAWTKMITKIFIMIFLNKNLINRSMGKSRFYL